MKPFRTLRNLFKSKTVTELGSLKDIDGWVDLSAPDSYREYKSNDYENAYSNVSKIVQGFASIEPYLIDENGKTIETHPVLDNLYNPNQKMSAYDFREALMLMFLIHDETYLRVHYKGAKLNTNSLTGFTFLEGVRPTIIEDKKTFHLKNGDTLTEDEVLCLYSANPYNLSKGFAAAHASRRWTRIDDYIADYQAGFFRNGAIPAGMFIIRAKTLQDYRDMKKRLEERHRGAGQNNNVTYSYQPIDSTGEEQKPQIEWISFTTQNKDMALKDLLEGVNNKVDSAFGVPSEIRGHLENSNYASVNVATRIFVDYTLRPFTLKLWDKFSHELMRVLGGFGAAITFDLPSPKIADEQKVQSESKQIDAQTIQLLVSAGFKLESIIDAFGYDEDYKLLKAAPKPVGQDNPNVDTGGEVNNPDNPISAYSKRLKVLDPAQRDKFEKDLETVVRNRLNEQVQRVIDTIGETRKVTKTLTKKAVGDPTDEDDELLAVEMMTVLLPLLYIYARTAQANGMALIIEAGLRTNGIKPFTLTPTQQNAYRDYLQNVAGGFNAQTAEKIRETLAMDFELGKSTAEITGDLRGLIDEEYRVRRMAVSEVNRAGNHASLYAMDQIREDTGYNIVKIWRVTSGNPCPICSELEGSEIDVSDSFWDVGDSLTGTDGRQYVNNFVDAETADAHPSCQCIMEYQVTGDPISLDNIVLEGANV